MDSSSAQGLVCGCEGQGFELCVAIHLAQHFSEFEADTCIHTCICTYELAEMPSSTSLELGPQLVCMHG